MHEYDPKIGMLRSSYINEIALLPVGYSLQSTVIPVTVIVYGMGESSHQ